MIRPILNLELQGACTGASGSTLDLSLTTVTGLSASIDVKDSVRVATIVGGNITLSGVQTIDGISVVAGDRVLVKNQTTTTGNGIYLCAAGAWTRATDFNLWTEIPGSVVSVEAGTVNAGTQWLCNVVAGGTIGSTAISFVVPKNFVDLTTSQTVTGQKTFVAPVLGAATATSINGITITAGGSGTLTMDGSINLSGTAPGSLTMSGNIGDAGGSITTNASGGSINTSDYGGSINTSGDSTLSGGSINTSCTSGNYPGGFINTSSNTGQGGNIDTRSPYEGGNGGSIDTSGDVANGGSINTSGSAASGGNGGSINTSGSGAVAGGSINTSGGGGSISTIGTGSIELGVTGTRTTFTGNATSDISIALPNAGGTLVLNDNTATITNKDIVATQLSGNIAVARIATALTTPGAIGGTTPSTGAFTTISGTSTLTLGVVSSTAGTIVLRNASNAFTTTIVPGAVTASRQLNLPIITATDTVAVLGLAQTFSGNKTFSGTVSCGSTLAVTSGTTLSGGLNLAPQYGALLTTTTGLSDYQGSATLTLGSNGPSVYGPGPIAWFSFNDAAAGTVYFPVWGSPP